MSLQDAIRGVITTLAAAAPDASVSVVINGATVSGLRGVTDAGSDLALYGEQGVTTGRVRIDASDCDAPARGSTIIVDGKTVRVTRTQLDTIGALLLIEFQETRPVEGV